MKPAQSHRGFPIPFAALALTACVLLLTACVPAPAALPTARGVAAPDSGGSAQATTASTASPMSTVQLQDFVTGYACAPGAPITLLCGAYDEFILAGTAGPAAALYSTGANVKTSQLIASATKMPAAAAILTALNKAGLTPAATVDAIVTTYLNNLKSTNKTDPNATAFQAAWTQMEQAIDSYWGPPQTGQKTQVTIAQLLSMTSGLTTLKPDPLDPLKLNDPQPDCMNDSSTQDDPYTHYTLAACATQIATVVQGKKGPQPEYVVFKPGTKYGYSYASYQVAGYVATLLDGPTYAGNWISFFKSTFTSQLGLSSYSYNNDLQQYKTGPSPSTVNVTNPRISGGASCDAYDYSTILTAILVDNGKVVPMTVVSWLTTNQLPNQLPSGWIKTPPDDGMNPAYVYDIPLGLSPTAAAPFVQGYSFGLFIPTSMGVKTTTNNIVSYTGFLTNLNKPTTPNGNNALTPADLTQPHNAAKIFLDPGLNGTVGWLDTDPASTFSAVNLIFQSPDDTNLVGLDMMRTASSAISCQFQSPGLLATYPSPINGSYCVAPPGACTPGSHLPCGTCTACECPQKTCNPNGTWGPCMNAVVHSVSCP